jgi:hypothetical protein
MHVMVHTKIGHNLMVFSMYPSFIHHGGNFENNFHKIFVIDDGLCPNLALCYEINAHMNDLIIQQSIILILRTLSHFCNSIKRIKKYYI